MSYAESWQMVLIVAIAGLSILALVEWVLIPWSKRRREKEIEERRQFFDALEEDVKLWRERQR